MRALVLLATLLGLATSLEAQGRHPNARQGFWVGFGFGSGSVGVFASHSGSSYTTKVDASHTPGSKLVVGHTLPSGSSVKSVELDGSKVSNFDTRTTNRGLEVTVPAKAGDQHTLVVTVG